MATPAGYKVFVNGDILDADVDVNPFLMSQAVMVFDDAAARTAALDGDEAEGMLTYLRDTDQVEKFTGAAFVPVSDAIALDDLTDVDASSPTDGQALVYDDGNWIAATPPLAVDDLTDVDASSPTDGQVLTYNNSSGNWEAATPAAAVSPIGLILALGG